MATIIFGMVAERHILTNLLETATQLDIPASWLKDAAVSGAVPCLFIGKRKMLFDPEAVEKAMASLARGEKERVTCLK